MDDLVKWLAPSLARFQLPDNAGAPADLPLALNAAFGLDFRGSRLSGALASAVLSESHGLVSVLPTPAPAVNARREGLYLTITGQRRLLISAGNPVAEWVD